MKRTTARTHVIVNVECPECGWFDDIFDHKSHVYDAIREEFNSAGEMRSDDCEIEVTCDECKKQFIVERIAF